MVAFRMHQALPHGTRTTASLWAATRLLHYRFQELKPWRAPQGIRLREGMWSKDCCRELEQLVLVRQRLVQHAFDVGHSTPNLAHIN